MLRVLATLLATALLLVGALGAPAWAHPMPSSEVLLDVRASGVHAVLTLPLTALALGWGRTLASDAAEVAREDGDALTGYVAAHVRASAPDGRPWSVLVHDVRSGGDPSDVYLSLEMTPPLGAPPDRLTLGYDVIFDRLVTHVAIVSVRDDFRHGLVGGSPLLLGTLRDTNPSMAIDCSGGSVWRGLAAMFRLGTQHIAGGTDHLLFLLALLLPASLRAIGGRWGSPLGVRAAVGRVVRVLTAFTVGHSATLALGVIGWVSVPAAIVEPAIALSIVAAALHARPRLRRTRGVPRRRLRPRARARVRRHAPRVSLRRLDAHRQPARVQPRYRSLSDRRRRPRDAVASFARADARISLDSRCRRAHHGCRRVGVDSPEITLTFAVPDGTVPACAAAARAYRTAPGDTR